MRSLILLGIVMEKLKGQADGKILNKILIKKLDLLKMDYTQPNSHQTIGVVLEGLMVFSLF